MEGRGVIATPRQLKPSLYVLGIIDSCTLSMILNLLHDTSVSMSAIQREDWQAKSMGYHAAGYKSLDKRCTHELHKQGKRGVQMQGWVP